LRTDQLIQGLVADLPTSSGSVARTLVVSLVLSLGLSVALMILWLGPRPELNDAMLSSAFWIKAGYAFIIGTAGLLALERLGRPGASAAPAFAIVSVLIASMMIVAVGEMAIAPPAERREIWFGNSSSFCPWAIAVLSIPLLVAGYFALRRLAPTRYALAGVAAGLMAGGYGACIYSIHCTEHTVPFLATWYTLGVLVIAFAGMCFSNLLRW
jgi:hypothetical protein